MKRERRTMTNELKTIKEFREIENKTCDYQTETIRFKVEKIDNMTYKILFPYYITSLIYEYMTNKNYESVVDDMYRHYLIVKTNDLSKEIKRMLVEGHTKHGLE